MFLYEKETDKKDNHEYIVITGFEGSAKELIIPDHIDDLPVEAIGSHAFSSRQDIEKVALPSTIRTLRSYVFHNSRSLKKISLFDSIDDYYDGVCRQCDSLEDVEITIERNWYEVIRNFLSDTDKALRFQIHISSQEKEDVEACLSFPGYVYDFNENTMARTIQFSIAGSGYAYRECVDRRKIDYRQYDNLFSKARIDGGSICEDIAIGRLLYPVELEERFKKEYENYVSDSGFAILKRLIDRAKDSDDAQKLLGSVLDLRRQGDFGSESLLSFEDQDKAMEYATSIGNPRVTSLLMEKGRNDSLCQSDYLHF
ncbi:leucine-rich repeat protein [Butyrivibrio sp. XBB1001]|uniref:leucine-rich repeat protein n=1 Tax=Butyrivibrio sp. XBB1001 TaxID=1280682 RepID=UPI0003F6B10C|nr:leucine-rich repeat protein [Butyrivibrio sp. XBB1001]